MTCVFKIPQARVVSRYPDLNERAVRDVNSVGDLPFVWGDKLCEGRLAIVPCRLGEVEGTIPSIGYAIRPHAIVKGAFSRRLSFRGNQLS